MTKRFKLMDFEDNPYIVDLTGQNERDCGIGTYEVLDTERIVDLLNEQHESIQFLKEYDKILQGQRIRLVNFLKEKGYSIEDIKGIMNDDKYLGVDLE